MRVLLQKVLSAEVRVGDETIGSTDRGYLLFLGVMEGDTEEQASWLAEKVTKLRLFPGSDGTINDQSILDVAGGILVVSQFTLAGRTEKGNRPDYSRAAPPAIAETLYESFVASLRSLGVKSVETGRFGASMEVALINDGPVTLVLDR
jgi:D-tyrosyl-tRNA(Tyr) deacylase